MTEKELEEMRKDPVFELGFQCGRLSRTIATQIITMSSEKKLKFENNFLKTQIRLAKAGKLDISKIELELF